MTTHKEAAADGARRCARLYTRAGKVCHLVPPWRTFGDVLCGLELPYEDWLGTGSQDEYDRAAEMPVCKRCYGRFMASVRCSNPECGCQRGLGGAAA